jgi:hypothetical protein
MSAIHEALKIVRSMKPTAGVDQANFAENTKRRLKVLEAALQKYSGKAPSSPGG